MILLGLLICLLCLSGIQSEEQLTQSEPAVIKPGSSHTLTCKGSGFNFSNHGMNWVRQFANGELQWVSSISYPSGSTKDYHDSVKGRFTISRDNSNSLTSLQMDNMKTEDSAVYYCARSWGAFDLWGSGTPVTVTAAEKSGPSVFPMVPCCDIVSSLTEVTIGCLSTNYLPAPVDVTWNSGSITTGIKNLPGVLSTNGNYISTSLLTISVSDFKNNKYTCNVDHKATGIKINKDIDACVDAPTTPPTVEVMQASCGETGSVDLVCLISGYSPDDIKIQWLLNGKTTSISPTNSTPYKDNEGNYGSRSQVTVPKEDWNSGDTYTCRVNHAPTETKNEDSIRKCEESTTSFPKVNLHPPSPKDLLVTKEPKVTCEVSKLVNTESLNIKWKRNDGKRVQAIRSEPVQQFDGTYIVTSLLRISLADWESEKSFICIVEHSDLPSPIEKTIQKRDEPTTEPNIYLFSPPQEELAIYDFVGLTCLIKKFSPKNLYVQWKKNDRIMDEDMYLNTEPILDEETDTYFMYSTALISKSDWIRGAKYTCSGLLSKITSKEINKTRGK